VTLGQEAADFQVAVNANGDYEIWEPSGRAINNIGPAIAISGQTLPRN
jgi:hypothetical protein